MKTMKFSYNVLKQHSDYTPIIISEVGVILKKDLTLKQIICGKPDDVQTKVYSSEEALSADLKLLGAIHKDYLIKL